MLRNPVGWFEIYVQDMPRAKQFYETVLQYKLEKLEAPVNPDLPKIELFAFPMQKEGAGSAGALVKIEGVPSNMGGAMVYFSCADCAVEAARVTNAGGSVYKEKTSIGQYGFIAMFIDTEGNLVGLHSMQ